MEACQRAGKEMINTEILYDIIGRGLRAPSGDNCQPWKFVYDKNNDFIDVHIVPERSGYDSEFIYFPDENDDGLCARVKLTESSKEEGMYPFIDKRSTNRRPFLPYKKIPVNVIKQLEESVKGNNSRLILSDNSKLKRKAALMAAKSDWIRYNNEIMHTEFMEKIRFSRKESEMKHDGFDTGHLGIGKAGVLFLRSLKPWKRMKFLNKFAGMNKMMSLSTAAMIMSSSNVGLIYTDNSTPGDFIKGGRDLERFWLTAAANNVLVQPMTVITLFIERIKKGQNNGFNAKEDIFARKLYEDFKEIFPVTDKNGLILLFRLGYGFPLKELSLRRPIQEMLTIKGIQR